MGSTPDPLFAPAPPHESTAVMSLVCGLLSMTCLGMFSGIPAIVLGITARRTIAQSGGTRRGGGLALGGIITGAMGTLATMGGLLIFIIGILTAPMSLSSSTYSPAPVDHTPVGPSGLPAEEHSPPPSASGSTHSRDYGPVHVVDLRPASGPLKSQLEREFAAATQRHQKLVIETTSTDCKACEEVSTSLRHPLMERALAHVSLVRVDVNEFRNDLVSLRMDESSLPWFYLMSSPAQVVDALSADEWDDNVPESMAPVLSDFVRGTLVERKAPRSGTSL